jgi:hypothetical protein
MNRALSRIPAVMGTRSLHTPPEPRGEPAVAPFQSMRFRGGKRLAARRRRDEERRNKIPTTALWILGTSLVVSAFLRFFTKWGDPEALIMSKVHSNW